MSNPRDVGSDAPADTDAGAGAGPSGAPARAAARLRPLEFQRRDPDAMMERAEAFQGEMSRRRTVRQFSTDPVPRGLIESAIRTAGTAPSGAHQQPWTWVVVSDSDLKQRIRQAAEEEEREFYTGRAPPEWLEALAPLGTDLVKSHITDAPYVVVLFRKLYEPTPDGGRRTLYYTQESCGLAAGFFIAAVHQMGLATLTHTPSPMGFLREILGRPAHEKPFLLLPVGYPARDAVVPDLARKPLDEISVWISSSDVVDGNPP